MNENRISQLMKSLDISREEAIDLIKEDEEIDKGSKKYELTGEAAKVSKKMRQADRKKTVYNFDTSKREKKENPVKRDLIVALVNALHDTATDVTITNPERQIDFLVDGVRYRIVLSAPRK